MADISRLVLEVDSQGVIHATGNLQKFSEAAERVKSSASGAEKQASTLDDVFSGLNTSSLAAAAGVAGLISAVNGLIGFGKQAVQTYAQFEQIENSLSGVLKSSEKGKAFFEEMRSFSFETTFGVDTLSNAASQLLNVGFAADKIKPTLKMLGDAAGGDTNKFNELNSIFAKIQNTGKATSVQLQQLALRGVPIYQAFKELGIQGTGSAEDITRAFEYLTTEMKDATGVAGIFADNMESINKTIQGKEGFVSDTFREFLASFAEASGLANAYKTALDIVYRGLQTVVNLLQKINSNPVLKAIFQGVLVAAIGALAVVIGGALVSALSAAIAKLAIIATLKAAINPASMAIGVGVAVASWAALSLAMDGCGDSAKDVAKSQEKLEQAASGMRDALGDTKGSVEQLAKAFGEEGVVVEEETIKVNGLTLSYTEMAKARALAASKDFKTEEKELRKRVKTEGIDSLSFEEQANYYGKQRTKSEAEIAKWLESNVSVYKDTFGSDWERMWEENGKQEQLKEMTSKLAEIEKTEDRITNAIEKQKEAEKAHNDLLKERDELNAKFAESVKDIEDAYSKTDEGKKESLKQQIEYYKELKKASQYDVVDHRAGGTGTEGEYLVKVGGMDAEHLHMIDVILEKLQADLDGTSGKAKEAAREMADWQAALKSAFNFSDKDTEGPDFGFVKNGAVALDEYIKRIDTAKSRTDTFYSMVGEDSDALSSELDGAKKALQSLVDTGLWESDEATIQNLLSKVKELQDQLRDQDFSEALAQLKKEGELIGKSARELAVMELVEEKKFKVEQAEALVAKEGTNAYLKQMDSLHQQVELLKVSELERAKILNMQEKMSEEEAKALALEQERVDTMKQMSEGSYYQNKASSTWKTAAENFNATDRQNLDTKSYAAGKAGDSLLSAVQGTDAGNFIQGFQEGGIWGAIINTVINALVKVVGSMEEFIELLNPVTKSMEMLKPLLKEIFDILNAVNDITLGLLGFVLKPLAAVLSAILRPLKTVLETIGSFISTASDNFMADFESTLNITSDTMVEVNSELDDTEARLKSLNDQYKSLLVAMDEQEQYYLQKKTEVNADAYNRDLSGRSVNDMILTPQGNFSTHPDDYIIATKNPASIGGGGGVNISVVVNNTASDVATASVTSSKGEDGSEKLFITISKRIAADVADGRNGWDNALTARSARLGGRRLS